jgi:predicted DNA repair protein MutK
VASGFAALLDDIAAIAKLAATSLDDVGAAAGKAGTKAVGVVVDDAAVTPAYAMGFTPDRELPIVWKIAKGSLRNKMLFLLPGALLLAFFAPWAVTPILMLGGAYLCFEATEKIFEALAHHGSTTPVAELALSSTEMEAQKVAGAIRTDLILSGEIMAISLSTVADQPFAIQAASLVVVSFVLTAIVYGVVGLIVKMDDVGLHLASRSEPAARHLGRGLVKAMPALLAGLSIVGTAAMLWVGGGIIVHGLEGYHVPPVPAVVAALEHHASALPGVGPAAAWIAFAVASALAGLVVGGIILAGVHALRRR